MMGGKKNKIVAKGHHNIIMQDINDSVIIVNQHSGEPVQFAQNLNAENIDIVPKEYKTREELHQISQQFEMGKHLVLLNGEGGIGKTTLAAKYIQEYKHNYKHYVWINAQFNILEEMLKLYYILNIQQEDISEELQIPTLCRILNTLTNKNKCLLVLDNANDEEQLRSFKKHFGGLEWDILITSRCNNLEFDTNVSVLRIEQLSPLKAKSLFCDFYEDNTDAFQQELDYFLDNVAYNTLLITLFGRYMKRCNRNRKGAYTLAQLNADFRQKTLFAAKDSKKIVYQLEEKTVNLLLSELYQLTALGKDEKEALFLFAFMPLRPISFQHLLEFTKSKLDEDQLDDALYNLYTAGWLQASSDNTQTFYKVNSPVIQSFIIAHYKEKIWGQIVSYVENISDLLNIDQTKDNPINKLQWVDYGATLLDTFEYYSFLQAFLHNPVLSSLQNNLALVHINLGNYTKAGKLLEQALLSDVANFGKSHPKVAIRQNNLAAVHQHLGNYTKSAELLEAALQSDIANFGETHPDIAMRQNNLATVYKNLGNYAQAAYLLEKALQYNLENFGENHPDTARYSNNLGLVYQDLGDYASAVVLLERALQSDIDNFGETHPNVAIRQSNLGLAYRDLGDYTKAAALLEKALQSDIANFSENHPNVAIRQNNLAMTYQSLGDYTKALELFKKALASDIANFGGNHPNVAIRQGNLAMIYQNLGNYTKAVELLEKALQSDIANFGENHPHVATNQSNLGLVYQDLEDYTKAAELLEKALQSDIANFGESHPNVAFRKINLANAYKYLDEYTTSIGLIKSALNIFYTTLPHEHPYIKQTEEILKKLETAKNK